jgi:hypothetical protein
MNNKIFNDCKMRMTQNGWQISMEGSDYIQFAYKKRFNSIGAVLGISLLFFWGLGVFVLLLSLIEYILKKDKYLYITAAQVENGEAERLVNNALNGGGNGLYFALLGLCVFVVILFLLIAWA